tara:strand:- start:1709 stop:2053 length:345 start_codon:yes stop_codon:yes gene_type:complete
MNLNNTFVESKNNELSNINIKISKKIDLINNLNFEIKKLESKKKKIIKKSNRNSVKIDQFKNSIYNDHLINFENSSKKGHIVNHVLVSMDSSKFKSIFHRKEYISDSSDDEIGF